MDVDVVEDYLHYLKELQRHTEHSPLHSSQAYAQHPYEDSSAQLFFSHSHPSFKLSLKSVIREVMGVEVGVAESKHIFDNIWRGTVPPKVKIMCWFALIRRLNTRDMLAKMKIIGAEKNVIKLQQECRDLKMSSNSYCRKGLKRSKR
ncbi:hypothetical protein PIB30_052873 [Stylosanthes scabra]|uniref:Reverse transcriptase zinc-binding domain-containing protein n=1 Tax=Stylosanthes scabra TaxID=79078 RepID=A0ABU6WJE0_9FABA|nr:hypothetical protein [Stylosanthes scabra]